MLMEEIPPNLVLRFVRFKAKFQMNPSIYHYCCSLALIHAPPLGIHNRWNVGTHRGAYYEEKLIAVDFPQCRVPHLRFGEIPIPSAFVVCGELYAPSLCECKLPRHLARAWRRICFGHISLF